MEQSSSMEGGKVQNNSTCSKGSTETKTPLCHLFDAVVSIVRSQTPTSSSSSPGEEEEGKIQNGDRLKLYGWYKQATVGPCSQYYSDCDSTEAPRLRPPSVFSVVARAKFEAWMECNDMTTSEAMLAYVEFASQLKTPHGKQCKTLLETYYRTTNSIGSSSTNEKNKRPVTDTKEHKKINQSACNDNEISAISSSSIVKPATSIKKSDGSHNDIVSLRQEEEQSLLGCRLDKEESVNSKLPKFDPASNMSQNSSPTTVLFDDAENKKPSSILERCTGIKPLIPRGQLDIGWADLTFAAYACLRQRTDVPHCCQLEKEIENYWQQQEQQKMQNQCDDNGMLKQRRQDTPKPQQQPQPVVVGLSVRSLLDLYLTSKSYPSGSQVIVVPPINIPDMLQILLYHNLKIAAVDLPPPSGVKENENDFTTIGIDLKAVERLLQQTNNDSSSSSSDKKTVVILVVHPFGMIMPPLKMNGLMQLAARYGVDMIEDCAECFAGMYHQKEEEGQQKSYLGFSGADVSLFSFGPIKTATAVGGGIAVVRDEKIAQQMKRIQHNVFGTQSWREYLWKVVKCCFVFAIAQKPTLCGLLLWFCQCIIGVEYDQLVSSLTRGFSSLPTPSRQYKRRNNKFQTTTITTSIGSVIHDESNEQRRRELIVQIRKRPTPALLCLLLRRLKQHRTSCNIVKDRIKRCKRMTSILKEHVSQERLVTPRPSSDSENNLYWLYPVRILTSHRSKVSEILLRHGYDVPPGTSQLRCASGYLNDTYPGMTAECPRAEQIMNEILYLPIASRAMSTLEMVRLAKTIDFATSEANREGSIIPRTKCPSCGGLTATTPKFAGRRIGRGKLIWDFELLRLLIIVILVDAWMFRFLPGTLVMLRFLHWTAVNFIQLVVPVYLASLLIAHLITCCISDVYLNSSLAFAQYNGLLNSTNKHGNAKGQKSQAQVGNTSSVLPQLDPVREIDSLKLPEPVRGDEQSASMALLTGATGFLGSLLLRDLLLHRNQLGIPGGIVVVCRANRTMSPQERVAKLLSDPMYSFLSPEEKVNLVTVIQGDVTLPHVGMSHYDARRVFHQLDISHVFHCAASVSFTQTLEDAAKSNITAPLLMQALTKKLKNKSAKYVHISTAFVHGDQTGTLENPLPEDLFPLDEYDASKIHRSMLETQAYASAAMTDLKFHNAYAFSKCVCEHLLLQRDPSANTIIMRPSIVGPALQSPYEGWAGEKPSTLVAAACLYLSYHWNLWCFSKTPMSVIPVDVVSRCILVKAFDGWEDQSEKSERDESESASSSSDEDGFEKIKASIKHVISTQPSETSKLHTQHSIHNIAWNSNSKSPLSCNWHDFGIAVIQVGIVRGHVGRFVASFALMFIYVIYPKWKVDFDTYQQLHSIFVQTPFNALLHVIRIIRGRNPTLSKLEQLGTYLDLPLLFYPYTTSTFHFQSDLSAPATFNGERYMLSCLASAENFVSKSKSSSQTLVPREKNQQPNESSFRIIAGRRHRIPCSDLWWALTQPRGNFAIRVAGYFLIKLFRLIAAEVTIDMESFAELASFLARQQDQQECDLCVILAPTHRSLLDFLLLSFAYFSIPELGVSMPHIVAAEEFSRIPLLGWMASRANAFFVKRGKGKVDSGIEKQVRMRKTCGGNFSASVFFEVFIEGTRSRDRRFMKPKTGFLRCVAGTGGKNVVAPVTISYERIPEQSGLASEERGVTKTSLSIVNLLSWLKRVRLGHINIGRVHIASCGAIPMANDADLDTITRCVQDAQKSKMYVSSYHIKTTSDVLGVSNENTLRALQSLGCRIWPSCVDCDVVEHTPTTPSQIDEQWTVLLGAGHLFAPLFSSSHPQWSAWLDPSTNGSFVETDIKQCSEVAAVRKALLIQFNIASKAVEEACKLLLADGFDNPKVEHLMQVAMACERRSPLLLIKAASVMKVNLLDSSSCDSSDWSGTLQDDNETANISTCNDDTTIRGLVGVGEASVGSWGYRDSGFAVRMDGKGRAYVIMKGDRYGLSGRPLYNLLPFIEKETGVRVDYLSTALPLLINEPVVCVCDLNSSDLKNLETAVSSMTSCPIERARHGTGHTQEDMYLLRSGLISSIRIPDAVVWPSSEEEVERLIKVSCLEGWCLIPFGGGTNVSHSTRCPSKDDEPRPIISVDMRSMNRVLWVNEQDGLAHVQAGITGGALVREMKRLGFTIGHEPDSIEFSTLGGWIATKASGMKKNKYGNIEDIVKGVRVVTRDGVLSQNKYSEREELAFGRVSTGFDLTNLVLGSEGGMGIITSAIIRIWTVPETVDYDSVILPSFEDGLRFVREVAKKDGQIPASVRLLDNEQFRLGRALQSRKGLAKLKQEALKWLASFCGPYNEKAAVCVTLTYEGSKAMVALQQKSIRILAAQHGGILAGSEIGRAGYEMTFAIAYLRDFAMTYHFLCESFETFVPWSRLEQLISATKERIRKEHKKRRLPGRPLIASRVTQLYHEGACVYFYFCMNFENVKEPSAVFGDIESAARTEILENGGSLSHHHGVGKLRASFMSQINQESLTNLLQDVKKCLDPENIFAARNGGLAKTSCSEATDIM